MRFLPGHRLGFLDKLSLHLFFISVIICSSLVSSFLGAAFVFSSFGIPYKSLSFPGMMDQTKAKMMKK